jgi:adenylyltransferase/sulfurtransferase
MKNSAFSHEELQRYSRHLILPEFGEEGQLKLKQSSVLVVGAGGLGCPVLLYLAAAGVGKIGVVDFDVVDRSNLQRQVLFTEDDIGKYKSDTAIERLSRLNPGISFINHSTRLTSENALEIIDKYDLVADGSDNFPTRYLVNDACVILKKPNVHGSIFRFEGQVSVFNHLLPDGSRGPQYRDIFPSPPPPALVTSCAEGGVLGVLPGIIGSLQANEIIKVLTGIGEPLAGRLFIMDALNFETRTMKIRKNPELKPVDELIDYEDFCGLRTQEAHELKEISARDLKELVDKKEQEIQIIDVREPHEYQLGNIGGLSIPLGKIEELHEKISQEGKKIVVCRSGVRSQKAIGFLKNKNYNQLYNLKGGLLEWAKTVDSSLVL